MMRTVRIGLIQNNRLMEERLIRGQGKVTLGQGPGNTLVLPSRSLPRSHTLLHPGEGRYLLNLTDQMRGRVRVGERTEDLGGCVEISLDEASQGRVTFDDVILLFQMVDLPRARAQLPRAVLRGKQDWLMNAILCLSMALHLGAVSFLALHDGPIRAGMEPLPERFGRLLQAREPPPPVPPEGSDLQEPQGMPLEEAQVAPTGRPQRESRPAPATGRDRLRGQVAQTGLIRILGAKGGQGLINDLIQGGATAGDLDAALDGISGIAVASANLGRRSQDGRMIAGTPRSLQMRELLTSGAGQVKGQFAAKAERKVTGIIKVAPGVDVDGTCDIDAVKNVVARGLRAIRICYERELKRNSKLSGKIVISFTIGPMGRVTRAQVVSDSLGHPAVALCIRERIKRWRFPKPQGGSVTAVYPFVFVSH